MLASFLAVLSYKLIFYTVVLVSAMIRLSVWKRRCSEKEARILILTRELTRTQDQLITMGAQVNDWRVAANVQAARALAAEQQAGAARTEAEAGAMKVLQTPVPDGQAIDFLRSEAQS